MTLDDLLEAARVQMLELLKQMVESNALYGITFSSDLNKAVISNDPQTYLDYGFGSSELEIPNQSGTVLGGVYEKAMRVRKECMIYVIARDEGMERAMIWKLAND